MTDPMREAFEREVLLKRGWKTDYAVTDGVFKYTSYQVQQAYEVWQAALSQPRTTHIECAECHAGFEVEPVKDVVCKDCHLERQVSQPRMTEDEAIEIMASAVSRNGWKDYNLAEADAKAMYRALLAKLPAQQNALIDIVNKQAEDEGLWFDAQTAPEAYLQLELRRLHSAVEDGTHIKPPVQKVDVENVAKSIFKQAKPFSNYEDLWFAEREEYKALAQVAINAINGEKSD